MLNDDIEQDDIEQDDIDENITEWFGDRTFATALQVADKVDECPSVVREAAAEVGASEVNGEYVLTEEQTWTVREMLREEDDEDEQDDDEEDDEDADDEEDDDRDSGDE